MNEWDKWLETRPEAIRAIAKKAPAGSCLRINNERLFVVGYSEYDEGVGLILSHIDPAVDYAAAIKTRIDVCAVDTARLLGRE